MTIEWSNETRRLCELKPRFNNPRYITKTGAKYLLTSWDKFGQFETLQVNTDNTILNGHQRYYVLLAAYENEQMQVDVRVPDRFITEREWAELTVYAHESATGGWDWDTLANWDGIDTQDLIDWGFSEERLGLHAGFIDLNVDSEADGFASAAQFGDGVQVVISTTNERLNEVKAALFDLLAQEGLEYKVKTV